MFAGNFKARACSMIDKSWRRRSQRLNRVSITVDVYVALRSRRRLRDTRKRCQTLQFRILSKPTLFMTGIGPLFGIILSLILTSVIFNNSSFFSPMFMPDIFLAREFEVDHQLLFSNILGSDRNFSAAVRIETTSS